MRILAIVGPTASGKTKLSLAIAKKYDGEIVSADSRQIYRGMDIGTAKPSPEELATVPHYLVNIKDPDEPYSVADYKTDAETAINNILGRGKLPVLVGGTGLYLKAVLENLSLPAIKADPELRAELEKEISRKGLPALFDRLVTLDPEAAHVVDPNNPRRVVRALEVAITSGEPFTAQQKKGDPIFDALVICLQIAPDVLRERIDQRIDGMMRDGLVEEVRGLIEKYGPAQAAFEAIGYREVVEYLDNGMPLSEVAAAIKMDTWHYAKRQMTWFRKDESVRWIQDANEAFPLIKNFLGT